MRKRDTVAFRDVASGAELYKRTPSQGLPKNGALKGLRKWVCCPRFTGEETEAQRSLSSCDHIVSKQHKRHFKKLSIYLFIH